MLKTCEATFWAFFLYYSTQRLFLGGGGVIAQFKFMHSCKYLQTLLLKVSVFLHICRILHLAIIHEEEFIAQQLIQLFPKNVLDIQNNLYQVSLTCLFLTTQ